MRGMPYSLKEKLRQYDRTVKKAQAIHEQIVLELEKYGVPYDNLCASSDSSNDQPMTEALAFISYNEGDIEDNIADIEQVFLYFCK